MVGEGGIRKSEIDGMRGSGHRGIGGDRGWELGVGCGAEGIPALPDSRRRAAAGGRPPAEARRALEMSSSGSRVLRAGELHFSARGSDGAAGAWRRCDAELTDSALVLRRSGGGGAVEHRIDLREYAPAPALRRRGARLCLVLEARAAAPAPAWELCGAPAAIEAWLGTVLAASSALHGLAARTLRSEAALLRSGAAAPPAAAAFEWLPPYGARARGSGPRAAASGCGTCRSASRSRAPSSCARCAPRCAPRAAARGRASRGASRGRRTSAAPRRSPSRRT